MKADHRQQKLANAKWSKQQPMQQKSRKANCDTKLMKITQTKAKLFRHSLFRCAEVIKRYGPILLLTGLISGCVSPKSNPAYPALDPGTPASVLKIENQMAVS